MMLFCLVVCSLTIDCCLMLVFVCFFNFLSIDFCFIMMFVLLLFIYLFIVCLILCLFENLFHRLIVF